MRFIQLTFAGPRGMVGRVAVQHMVEAMIRSGKVEGALHISYPRSDGIYWVAFQNHGHATAFLDIIGQLNVDFRSLQAKPEGVWFGRINTQAGVVEFHSTARACESTFGVRSWPSRPALPLHPV